MLTVSTSPCQAGDWCANFDRITKTPAPLWDSSHGLCTRCRYVGQQAVGQLVYDYRDLEQYLPQSTSVRLDGQPGFSSEMPIPIRTDVEALQAAIVWITDAWAEVLTERHHLADPPSQVRDGYRVQWACSVLAPRVDALARVEPLEMADYPDLLDPRPATQHDGIAVTYVSGPQAVLDLIGLHARARGMLGLTNLIHRMPGYCDQCGQDDLRRDNGRDTVYCGRCRASQSRDAYEQAANVFLRGN